MVDAVGIKVLLHILEATHPPLTTVCNHAFPVVCRKSPVLSIYRESIWWSTGLRVEMKVFWLVPYITTIAVYTDRNIALKYYATCTCIIMGRAHLAVEHILHIIEERNILECLILRIRQSIAIGFVPLVVVLPLIKFACAVLVAQIAILCIGYKPMVCSFEERLKILRFKNLLAFLLEQHLQVFYLSVVHTLIVNLWQGIKLLAQHLKTVSLNLVVNSWQLA